jgi:hypothetical protein
MAQKQPDLTASKTSTLELHYNSFVGLLPLFAVRFSTKVFLSPCPDSVANGSSQIISSLDLEYFDKSQ